MNFARNSAIFALVVVCGGCALTQKYPDRQIQLIEPFGAGSGVDVVARVVAARLADHLAQPVAVENKTGGGGTVAAAYVAKSLPDGYTLLVSSSAQAYSAALLTNLPYNPLTDFVPVAPLSSQPYVLVVGQSAGVKTVGELVALVKAKPGELKFGSAGVGTGTHLGAEKFNLETGISAIHVPMTPAQAIAETIAGRITYWLAPISLAAAPIREGKLLPLGVSSRYRSSVLPNVPTLAEAGVSGFDFTIWYGIWAPSHTPPDVVDQLAREIARVVASPDVRASFAKGGAEQMLLTQKEFTQFIVTETENASRIIRAARIKP